MASMKIRTNPPKLDKKLTLDQYTDLLKESSQILSDSVTVLNSSRDKMIKLIFQQKELDEKVERSTVLMHNVCRIGSSLEKLISHALLKKEEVERDQYRFENKRKQFFKLVNECSRCYNMFKEQYGLTKELCLEIIKECKKKEGPAAAGATTAAVGIGVSLVAGIFSSGIDTAIGLLGTLAAIAVTVGVASGAALYFSRSFEEAANKFNAIYTDMEKLNAQLQTLGEYINSLYHNADIFQNYYSVNTILDIDTEFPGIIFFKVPWPTTNITLQGETIDRLKDIGISILVPKDAIKTNIELYIRPCFYVPFQLPPEYEPASPAYLIRHCKKIEFLKDVIVRIHHYAHLETEDDCEDMAFFSASFSQSHECEYNFDYDDYKTILCENVDFKKICGVNRFSKDDQIGEISLRHFCVLKIGRKRIIEEDSEKNEKKHKGHQHLYSANLYKYVKCERDVSAIFCMCLYTPLHIKVCNDKFSEVHGMKAECQSEVVATITGDKVEVKAIWTAGEIEFDRTPPIILKRDIDWPEIMGFSIEDMTLQKLIIYIKNVKSSSRLMDKPKIQIIGLDRECTYNNLPIPSYLLPPLPIQYPHREKRLNEYCSTSYNLADVDDHYLGATQPVVYPQESNLALDIFRHGSFSSPQTSPTQHSVLINSTQASKEEREERPQEHSKVASIDDSDLDVDDLEDVLEAVKTLANEWKTLLTRLHIKLDTLQTIHSNNPKDIISCLHIGLSKWLKMNYDYRRHGNPSWRMLAMAVSDIDNRLFEKIAKDHPKK